LPIFVDDVLDVLGGRIVRERAKLRVERRSARASFPSGLRRFSVGATKSRL
jgi:hypothetical protein